MRSGLRFFPGSLPETLNKHLRVPGTAVREPNINSGSGCQNTRLDADFLVSRQEMAHIPAPDSLDGQSVVHMLSRADDLCQSFTVFFPVLHKGVICFFLLFYSRECCLIVSNLTTLTVFKKRR